MWESKAIENKERGTCIGLRLRRLFDLFEFDIGRINRMTYKLHFPLYSYTGLLRYVVCFIPQCERTDSLGAQVPHAAAPRAMRQIAFHFSVFSLRSFFCFIFFCPSILCDLWIDFVFRSIQKISSFVWWFYEKNLNLPKWAGSANLEIIWCKSANLNQEGLGIDVCRRRIIIHLWS